jgi:hypothetical protein
MSAPEDEARKLIEEIEFRRIVGSDTRTRRWRIWWRVFGLILRVMHLVPVAEWRREQWSWRLDIWGMDHFGGRDRE